MSEYRLAVKGGSVWPQISGRRGRPPPTVLHVTKLDALTFHMAQEFRQKVLSFCDNSCI